MDIFIFSYFTSIIFHGRIIPKKVAKSMPQIEKGDGFMKIIVLGGVAAGTKAAAKLMRENHSDEVLILNKGIDISYAGCGLPF